MAKGMTKADLLVILEDIDDDDEVVLISQPDNRHPSLFRLDKHRSGQYADKVYLVEGVRVDYVESEIKEAFQLGY